MDTTERSYSGESGSSATPDQSGDHGRSGGSDTARSAIGGAAEAVRSQSAAVAAQLTETARQAARSAGQAVGRQATEMASQVGDELSKTAEAQKSQGVEALQSLARAISTAAGELDDRSPLVARYVRDAAGKVEEFSDTIGNRNVNELVQAATELARSQPVLFFGGAVAAGFAFARFLKSSADGHRRYRAPGTGSAGASERY
jgi:hypothetical protein